MVMDRLTDEVRQEFPWTMMFYRLNCDLLREQRAGGMVRLQGGEIKKVDDFKYSGSTAQSNGECAKEEACASRLEWVKKSVRCDV